MAMSRSYRLQVANTFLLIVVGLLVVVSTSDSGGLAPALRWTIYGAGTLIVIFAFREILTAAESEDTTGEMVVNGDDDEVSSE